MQYNSPLTFAKKLISLPSFVSATQDETPATDFLARFLKDTFPEMSVEKQHLEDSRRYNLILRGKKKPKLLVIGHIDTVQPKSGWRTDPLIPVIQSNSLYGLGAADMKSSLAAFLYALIKSRKSIALDSLMLLIYVDEEYDFKGIRRFLADDVAAAINPNMILSLDGELAVGTGCRGLVEIGFMVTGKSGHSSNPDNGISAITETLDVLNGIGKALSDFKDEKLGETTTNIAYLRGGVLQQTGGKDIWLREGNVIPDTAEVVFEVRTATPRLNADLIVQKVKRALYRRGLAMGDVIVRHDIAPWPAIYDESLLVMLQKVYKQAAVPFNLSSRKLQGYIDAQMVTEKIPSPTFIIGTGGDNKHGANESVPLKNIEQAADIYAGLLREVL